MKEIFAISPDVSHFFAFLNGQGFQKKEMQLLENIRLQKVFVDAATKKLTIEYHAYSDLPAGLLEKVSSSLRHICGLDAVEINKITLPTPVIPKH